MSVNKRGKDEKARHVSGPCGQQPARPSGKHPAAVVARMKPAQIKLDAEDSTIIYG